MQFKHSLKNSTCGCNYTISITDKFELCYVEKLNLSIEGMDVILSIFTLKIQWWKRKTKTQCY